MKIITSSILLLILFSCASIPEPGKSVTSIIVGELTYSGSGYNDSNGTGRTVNGAASFGIEITIKNLTTSEISDFRTWGKNGFFGGSLQPGKYAVTKLSYKDEGQNGWSQIGANPGKSLSFTVSSDSANNLGKILWTSDADKGTFFSYNKEYPLVKNDFEQKYNSSRWNSMKWKNVNFGETN